MDRTTLSLAGISAAITLLAACAASSVEHGRQPADGAPATSVTSAPPGGTAPPSAAAPGADPWGTEETAADDPTDAAVVSLTFDDTYSDQLAAIPMLQAHGMRATFYVNSARLGHASDYRFMTEPELRSVAQLGHEIGGHTLHHFDLVAAAPDEQRRQICDDRARLLALGYDPRTFAYPLGRRDAGVIDAVRECGYSAARITNHTGLEFPVSLVKPSSFEIAAAPSVVETTKLEDMQVAVREAERAGGWVVFVMHHVCTDCGSRSAIAPEQLQAFLDWLAPRRETGTRVRTVAEVVAAKDRPVRAAPRAIGGIAPGNRAPNPSFESWSRVPTMPDCWLLGTPGAKIDHFERVADAHDGEWAVRVRGVGKSASDRRVNGFQDAGGCAVPVIAGERLRMSAFTKGDTAARFSAYARDESGFWRGWASGPSHPNTDSWSEMTWDLPAVPDGTTAIAVGVALPAEGTITVDDVDLRAAP